VVLLTCYILPRWATLQDCFTVMSTWQHRRNILLRTCQECSAVTARPRHKILILEIGNTWFATTFSSLHFSIFFFEWPSSPTARNFWDTVYTPPPPTHTHTRFIFFFCVQCFLWCWKQFHTEFVGMFMIYFCIKFHAPSSNISSDNGKLNANCSSQTRYSTFYKKLSQQK
jgi:hypothetical protein